MQINTLVLAIFTWASYLTICIAAIITILQFIETRLEHKNMQQDIRINRNEITSLKKDIQDEHVADGTPKHDV